MVCSKGYLSLVGFTSGTEMNGPRANKKASLRIEQEEYVN